MAVETVRVEVRLTPAPDDTAAPKWTPGRWDAHASPGYDTIILDRSNTKIASIYRVGNARTDRANAALIAAAPSLYEALANLTPRFERACKLAGSGDEYIAQATAMARAALALARGETNG